MTNLSLNLSASATRHGDRVAIRLDDETLTFAELDDAARRTQSFLASKGIGVGDRVALMLPNVPAFAVVFYATLRLGAVVVPMNPMLKEREVAYYLRDGGVSLIVTSQACAAVVEAAAQTTGTHVVLSARGLAGLVDEAPAAGEPAERAGDDLAVILYTSGTTGEPKGAELSHSNLDRNQEITARTLIELGPDDIVMGCLPLFHVFGLTCGLNAAVAAGACLTLVPRFEPGQVLEVIARDRVTVFEGVPTMYAAMLHHPSAGRTDTSTLRTCVSGGSAMPVEVMRAFEETLGCVILEGYGLSETSPVACFNKPGQERKPGSIGTPIEGVEQRLVDGAGEQVGVGEAGEIQIRGHNIMRGYWQRPDATAAAIDSDGWFSSGDIATIDDDGYYTIVDRMKDVIIRGGYNVYPREVEEVLYEHPAVREAAVVGLAHDRLGEEVGAAVALKEGFSAGSEELIDFVAARLAAYKCPRQVWIVAELPKTATGKIMRRDVSPPGGDPSASG